MCDWKKSGWKRIDPRIRDKLDELQANGIRTLGSCCGHGKYPRTIGVKHDRQNIDLQSGTLIPRIRRFYRKDPEGMYYIPEVMR